MKYTHILESMRIIEKRNHLSQAIKDLPALESADIENDLVVQTSYYARDQKKAWRRAAGFMNLERKNY